MSWGFSGWLRDSPFLYAGELEAGTISPRVVAQERRAHLRRPHPPPPDSRRDSSLTRRRPQPLSWQLGVILGAAAALGWVFTDSGSQPGRVDDSRDSSAHPSLVSLAPKVLTLSSRRRPRCAPPFPPDRVCFFMFAYRDGAQSGTTSAQRAPLSGHRSFQHSGTLSGRACLLSFLSYPRFAAPGTLSCHCPVHRLSMEHHRLPGAVRI